MPSPNPHRPLYLALAVGGALAVTGCSSSSGAPSSAPTLEQACSDFASVIATRQATCYGVAPAPNESTLITRNARSCVLMSSADGSQVGASYWEACASTVNNGCHAARCADYPPGTRQAGAACLVSLQCATLWCKGTAVAAADGSTLPDAIQCGECATRLPLGASCDAVADVCELGLSCFGGVCRTLGLKGDPCAHGSDCIGPSLVCKSTGVCEVVTPDGQACDSSKDCTTSTGCDAVSKVCAPAQYLGPGDACDGQVRRCEAGSCDLVAGTCPAILADGAPCDAADPSKVCDDYARCFGGVCQIPGAAACQ